MTASLHLSWQGPFSWPDYESISGLPPLPRESGLYLWTFQGKTGFVGYCAGITRRPFPQRLKEHTRKYLDGQYTVLDPFSAQKGERKEVWHGWSYARGRRSEFFARKAEITFAVHLQLAAFRVLVTEVENAPRILERLEARIMKLLYDQPAPYCNLPDQGMRLAPTRKDEASIVVENTYPAPLLGCPRVYEL
ncbi:MAG: hypothetical protein ACREDR_06945 [Blastocatellia bacterium]